MIYFFPKFVADLSNDDGWSVVDNLEFTKTQRGRNMLIYEGYRYVTNRNSTKNIFWRCSHYVKFGCRASVVTSRDLNTIRYAGAPHSHEPEKQLKWIEILIFLFSNRKTILNKKNAYSAKNKIVCFF